MRHRRLLDGWVAVQLALGVARARLQGERGEGVISAAIAVLIMALIGAAMWTAFNGVFQNAAGRISSSVNAIGG